MELNTNDLAGLFKITARQVQSLEAQGVLTKTDRGVWDLSVNLLAWVAHRVECEVAKVARTPAEIRLATAKAESAELKVERERDAHLAEANEAAIRVCDEVVGPLKADLYAIPARVTKDLGLRRRLEDQFDVAFTAAADRAAGLERQYQGQLDAAVPAPQPPNRAARRAQAARR